MYVRNSNSIQKLSEHKANITVYEPYSSNNLMLLLKKDIPSSWYSDSDSQIVL
jgi:hypothetical protein